MRETEIDRIEALERRRWSMNDKAAFSEAEAIDDLRDGGGDGGVCKSRW